MSRGPENFKLNDLITLLSDINESLPETERRDTTGYTRILMIRLKWAEAVTEQLAAHSRPLTLKKGILTVRCDHGIFAGQIQMLQLQLLRKLHEITGIRVDRIKTHTGHIKWPDERKQLKRRDIMFKSETMSADNPDRLSQSEFDELIKELKEL